MKELFDLAPCGYFSFFDDGLLHVVNETLCNLLGYKKEELDQANVEKIFTIPTRIFFQTHFFPLVKMHGHAEEIFISLQTKDQQYLPVLLNAKRSGTIAKPYTACAFIVVVNRKKFEDELVAARHTAENALKENSDLIKARTELQHRAEDLEKQMQLVKNRNHELGQINHVVTHSLREPVRKLMLYTDRLVNANQQDNLIKDFEKLNSASERMRSIVAGLQEYVWLNDNKPDFGELDLGLLFKKIEARFQDDLKVQLVMQTGKLPGIIADEKQIDLLVYHIFSNAVKFKKGNSANIFIEASIIQQNRFREISDKYKYEDFIKLQFKDEGIGFDNELKEEVFELFKKLHYTEGLGLGLALARKIVENHSGIIMAESIINKGTTITVLLPLEHPLTSTS